MAEALLRNICNKLGLYSHLCLYAWNLGNWNELIKVLVAYLWFDQGAQPNLLFHYVYLLLALLALEVFAFIYDGTILSFIIGLSLHSEALALWLIAWLIIEIPFPSYLSPCNWCMFSWIKNEFSKVLMHVLEIKNVFVKGLNDRPVGCRTPLFSQWFIVVSSRLLQ